MDRFAVLRMFVNKYKREGKVNRVAVEEAKARKYAKKRYAKIRKANQKKSNRGWNLWFLPIIYLELTNIILLYFE